MGERLAIVLTDSDDETVASTIAQRFRFKVVVLHHPSIGAIVKRVPEVIFIDWSPGAIRRNTALVQEVRSSSATCDLPILMFYSNEHDVPRGIRSTSRVIGFEIPDLDLNSAVQRVLQRLGLAPSANTLSETVPPSPMDKARRSIDPRIWEKCEELYEEGHLAEAVEKSFKVVRDRLRELTGYEKGSEAFGKGKLHIRGAVAAHVDADFNEGTKFLLMAIDMFRNEKSHTSDAHITDPARAQQYLTLSSLAMSLLDGAEIRTG